MRGWDSGPMALVSDLVPYLVGGAGPWCPIALWSVLEDSDAPVADEES